MQDASQLADSVAADSVAADTALVDTTGALSRLGQDIERVTAAAREGRFDEIVDLVLRALVDFALNGLVPALLWILLFWVLFAVLSRVIEGTLRRSRRVDLGVQQLIKRSFRLVLLAFATVVVLGELGMNVGALIAGLGIAGIALGFAARDTLENFISGITILLDQPFRVGDNVVIEDTFGTVQEITLRSTRIRTLNNEVAVLPNAHMIQNKVINHTLLGVLRVVIPFGIAYKEYPQQAREAALKTTEGDDRLHPDYPPSVVVTKMNDSSVDMELRLFLKDPKLEIPLRFDYLERVREALRAADIEIPFPHLQLFIDEAKAFEDAPFLRPGAGPEPPRAEA
jgi:small conductance mechanosensitive channel